MATYNSSEFCTQANLGYEGRYTHDRGSEVVVVKEPLLNTAELAEERATVELLEGAYSERIVNFSTVHTPTVKINDIVEFKGKLWVVKEISLTFTPPELIQNIKGVRYE